MPLLGTRRVIFFTASVSVYLIGIRFLLDEGIRDSPHTANVTLGNAKLPAYVTSAMRHALSPSHSPSQGRAVLQKVQDDTISPSSLLVEATLGPAGVTVWLDSIQVYKVVINTIEWEGKPVRLQGGVHLLTLHEGSGLVMRAASYQTWQPENSKQLSQALKDTRNGRLLLLLAIPEFTKFLGQELVKELLSQGSHFVDRLALEESWCLVLNKGRGVLHEVLITAHHGEGLNAKETSSASLQLTVPLIQAQRCVWDEEAGMEERATFCQTYEGYGSFCSCHEPTWSPLPHNPVRYPLEEVIPVAIVTARRLPHVLRQVGQVRSSPGGGATPITIFVDGRNPEATALAALLNLTLIQHHNPAPLGSSSRINEHVKFSLKKVFEVYPAANEAIILEDDLELAPDFIPYFQQTAPLLRSDPYLLFVNAFNYNSYAHTAHDGRRLYRAHGIPAYGWMTTRQGAEDMLANWVPMNQTNAVWDWWVRARVMGNRDMLLPEVPRTRHMGGGGTHISGFDQLLFSSQPLNTVSDVTLDVESAEEGKYEWHIREEMDAAQVVVLTQHPCEVTPIPTQQQTNKTYLLYIYQPDENKKHLSYEVISACLGINSRDMHENLRMMVTFPFYGNQVYLVACPHSPYCRPKHRGMIYRATAEHLAYASQKPLLKPPLRVSYAIRIPPQDPKQEITLNNRQIVDYIG